MTIEFSLSLDLEVIANLELQWKDLHADPSFAPELCQTYFVLLLSVKLKSFCKIDFSLAGGYCVAAASVFTTIIDLQTKLNRNSFMIQT